MSKGGSSGSSKIAPWSGATGAINTALDSAGQILQQPSPGPYPGQTVADLNPYQTTSLDWQAQRAIEGNQLNPASQQALMGQIQGGYNPSADLYQQYANNPQMGAYQALPAAYQNLGMAGGMNPAMPGLMSMGYQQGSNQHLGDMYGDAAEQLTAAFNRQVTPNISSMMSRAGRIGSDAHVDQQDYAQENLTQGLGDLAANMYGQQYQGDMQRQLQALQYGGGLANQGVGLYGNATGQLANIANMGMGGQLNATAGLGQQYQQDQQGIRQSIFGAPSIAGMDYMDIGQLGAAGGAYQQQQQQQLGAEQARWMDANYGPGSGQQWLNQYISQIAPFSGLGGFQQPAEPSTAQGVLGGAAGGAAIGSMLPIPGWGTLAGAGIGGLMGLLG